MTIRQKYGIGRLAMSVQELRSHSLHGIHRMDFATASPVGDCFTADLKTQPWVRNNDKNRGHLLSHKLQTQRNKNITTGREDRPRVTATCCPVQVLVVGFIKNILDAQRAAQEVAKMVGNRSV